MKDLNTVYKYHEDTKHHPQSYARSLGYLDWATQPDPFLKFVGAPLEELPLPSDESDPTWDQALAGAPSPALPGPDSLGRLFYGSVALAAWKQVNGPRGEIVSRWSLRVNPSSGNLHPTETWLLAPPGVLGSAGLFHYRPDRHGLELVGDGGGAPWPAELDGCVLVGLSSIAWREAWKYGERAFRYCNHDVGHALAGLDLAAGALGWGARLLDDLPTESVAGLLDCARRSGPEADHPDVLVMVGPPTALNRSPSVADLSALAAALVRQGEPRVLSPDHQPWPAIDQVIEATAWPGGVAGAVSAHGPVSDDRNLPFLGLVRGRRSAVSMDGHTALAGDAFFRLLGRLMPERSPRPFALLPWPPMVSLVLFVHRVTDVERGLYILCRDPDHEPDLRESLAGEDDWTRPAGCPGDLPLYRLAPGDMRGVARDLSCHQDIAADGAFAVGMLARFEPSLAEHGPGLYPRLFWETGAVGQMIYLEAAAARIQATGIGCFFDDEVHRGLGLGNRRWQSLYHFTVGSGVSDPRIDTGPAYPRDRSHG